jgi:hypothetical protein
MTRRGRPPNTWEPITTHREGGWLAPGRCGRPHLIGRNWRWWRCPVCAAFTRIERRRNSTDSINARQLQRLNLFYPEGDT